MGFLTVLTYFVPKGTWLKRTALLCGFIFLDFLVTVLSCKTPFAEANLYARSFMQSYGIVAGLALFDFLLAIPIYAILVSDSHLIKYTGQHSGKAEFAVDLMLGWLVAGAHFNGAASWLWEAPQLLRQIIGFIIYLAIAFPTFYPSATLSYTMPFVKRVLGETE
jgi:hypothetical protein